MVARRRRAAYRWRFLGTEIHDRAYSRTVVVRVVHPVSRVGRWTVFTTVEAATGNLAGRSGDRSASVS